MEYNLNGGSGTLPTDSSSPYVANSTVTVKPSTGFEKAGSTFQSWYTTLSGTGGTPYTAGTGNFDITDNITLYAKWV